MTAPWSGELHPGPSAACPRLHSPTGRTLVLRKGRPLSKRGPGSSGGRAVTAGSGGRMVLGGAGEGGAARQREAGRGCSGVPLPQGPRQPPRGWRLRLMTPGESRAVWLQGTARPHPRLLHPRPIPSLCCGVSLFQEPAAPSAMMAPEARASPGPRWVPAGCRTCPAQRFQGQALGWTAGNRAPQTARAGQTWPRLPAVLRPGPLRLPPGPQERGSRGNPQPRPRPASAPGLRGPATQRSAANLGQAGRGLGSCATQGHRQWTPVARAGRPGATARPPAEASPAQACRACRARRRPTCSPGRPSLAAQPRACPQARGLPAQQLRGHPGHKASASSSRRPGQPLPGSRAALQLPATVEPSAVSGHVCRAQVGVGLGRAGTGGLTRQQRHVKAEARPLSTMRSAAGAGLAALGLPGRAPSRAATTAPH